MVAALAACLAVLLLAAALRELGDRDGARRGRARVGDALDRMAAGRGLTWLLPVRLGLRLERAGLTQKVTPAVLVAGKVAGLALGVVLTLAVAPAAPSRLAPAVAAGLLGAGFLLPEALIERAARRRRSAVLRALPDALDLLAAGIAAGRSEHRVMGDIAASIGGPLGAELAGAVAEVECGASQRVALAGLSRRVPGAEVAGVVAALERSRRYGSPLADQLHDHAAELRREESRALEEHAARAAPKIQLVVALLLVPSVLAMLLAALVAHAGALLPTG
jgi:tight adherence protein C